jgi:tetratricopeptide (TPR) repeat protein
MSQLLKAMGFWIWGLIAVGLSVALISVNGRVLTLLRAHGPAAFTSTTPAPKESPPAVGRDSQIPSLPAISTRSTASRGLVISRIIAEEMTAAQKALQAGQWAEAIKQLDAALTKSPLTAFDTASIYRLRGFANIKLNNLQAGQADYETALATGAVSAKDKASMTRTLFSIAAVTGQFQKSIDYGEEMVDAGVAAPNDVAIIAQGYYQMNDCRSTATWADKAIAVARKAGEVPKENLFLFKLKCAADAADNQGMIPILVDLIRLGNKPRDWNTLLRIERQYERDDHNTLMLYRIMYDTGAMTVGTDYIEMAQLLGDASLPAEAQSILEKAMASGLINDQQKERTTRLLNSFKTRADADRNVQARSATGAGGNLAGDFDLKLGEIYYGSGDYQNSMAAIDQALRQPVTHLDEAYVYLGRAQVQLKNTPEAKKAFAGLKTVLNISPRVLKLYELYAEVLR